MKKISIVLALLMLSACSKTIDIEGALKDVRDVAKNTPQFYYINWYDTGQTCGAKLQLANGQIIRMDNKLYTIEKKLDNLIDAVK